MKLKFELPTIWLLFVCGATGANAQPQQSAPPPVASGAPPMAQSSTPSSTITNARVVEMTKLGLDDDVIVARIKHGVCDFRLSDSDLLALKNDGVPSKVVAAMLDS